jgi:two-component system, LuxR family, sensor kinase FixL
MPSGTEDPLTAMRRTGEPSATPGREPAGLEAETLASPTAMDGVFELFPDESTALVELDREYRIVRCNRGYAAACGREPADLAGSLPTELFTIHAVGRPGPNDEPAPVPYSHVAREEWRCGPGRHCTVTWLKLWICGGTDGRHYLKLGVARGCEDDGEGMEGGVQLQALLHAAPDAIITIDDRGRMLSVNPATEELFGYRHSELKGRNVSMLMPNPDSERHDDYLRHYRETDEARIIGIGREIKARRKNGDTFSARLSVSEFEANGSRFFTGMLHDVTDRIEAEEKQRVMFSEHTHASRVVALGEMASSIAHEINQPLTAIVSYADASRRLIESGSPDTETLGHALGRISEQGQRAGAIIRRLREFVRKKEPRRNEVDVNELIKAAVALTAHDAERHGVSLEFELDPQPLAAMADRLQVEQVVLNLVRNSIEAIEDAGRRNGRIRIGSRAAGPHIQVSVSDNGIGIKPSERESVFEPFHSTKETGTGLGLSISRSIVEAHGGTLDLAPNPDNGVTFTMTLPAGSHD